MAKSPLVLMELIVAAVPPVLAMTMDCPAPDNPLEPQAAEVVCPMKVGWKQSDDGVSVMAAPAVPVPLNGTVI